LDIKEDMGEIGVLEMPENAYSTYVILSCMIQIHKANKARKYHSYKRERGLEL
jgi:hypothetical protein